jgi:predicted dienelactone hydrolase
VKVEIYYPSTAAAVAGLPLDVLHVLGIDIAVAPTYRDVASAPGVFPVVLYSTGSGDPRYENQTLAVHLASYGFLVAAAEHHGNDLLDPSGDPDTATNRPRDMSFLLDQLLDFNAMPEHFLEGAIDGTRIGATGFSLGGYTAMALATGPFHLGAFADPRVKAILPLDGATWPFIPEFPSALSTITVPTLLLGGTQSPLAPLLPLAFDALLPGPAVMAYGNLIDAGHGTFDDVCGVPEAIVGVVPECQPDHVPWHYARHIMNYLALNFFDATLNGNAEALARLDPAVLANIEELTYQSK